MASEIMSGIIEAERRCDENAAAAKKQAAVMLETAEKEALEIIEQGRGKAQAEADAQIEAALKQSSEYKAAAAEKTAQKTAELKNASMANESRAVLAVAKKLVEIS